MQLVNDLVSQARWEEAHSMLTRYAQQSPNDPQIEYELGVLCYNMGNFADAEMHLKTSLSIYFDSADAHYHLGLTLLKEGRPQEAMPEFREACERKDNFAVGHLHWGLALAQMGSLRGALGQFGQAVKLNSSMSSAYYQSGIASHQLGQYIEAAQFFQRACNIDPGMAEAFNALGVTLVAMGSFPDAIQCFARAAQLDPELAIVHVNWAAALVSTGQIEEALKHYQEAASSPSRNLTAKERAAAYNDMAVNLFKLERAEEAGEKLVHAVDVDPNFVDARTNLGLVRMHLKEFDMAVEAFEAAFNAAPESKKTAVNLAVAYLFVGRYQEALEKLEPLTINNQSPDPNHSLSLWIGYAHMASGNTDKAKASFSRAIAENPANPLAFDGLGSSFALNGEHQAAVEKFQQCLSLNREFALGYLHLARSLEAIGHIDASMMAYREALTRDPNCLVPEKEAIELLLRQNQLDMVVNKSMRLLEIAPADADAKLSLAKALKAQNRLDDSLNLVGRLIGEQPEMGAAHVLAGQIFLAQGRFVEADDRFRIASEHCEGDSALFYGWGKALLLLGMHELAIEKFQKASDYDPYDPDIYEAWGSTLKHLGRFADAAEVYKRAAQYI